ncbi:methylenetetrahydrofolate reductase C-terminal domain-containing protein, partial [Chloroflexota bacterium]
CPVTICAKGLHNGPCGGSSLGKCEAGNNKDCAWELIYRRLKQQGQLDNLKTFAMPRDYKLQAHPVSLVKEF